jgi:hypothetical protein
VPLQPPCFPAAVVILRQCVDKESSLLTERSVYRLATAMASLLYCRCPTPFALCRCAMLCHAVQFEDEEEEEEGDMAEVMDSESADEDEGEGRGLQGAREDLQDGDEAGGYSRSGFCLRRHRPHQSAAPLGGLLSRLPVGPCCPKQKKSIEQFTCCSYACAQAILAVPPSGANYKVHGQGCLLLPVPLPVLPHR